MLPFRDVCVACFQLFNELDCWDCSISVFVEGFRPNNRTCSQGYYALLCWFFCVKRPNLACCSPINSIASWKEEVDTEVRLPLPTAGSAQTMRRRLRSSGCKAGGLLLMFFVIKKKGSRSVRFVQVFGSHGPKKF